MDLAAAQTPQGEAMNSQWFEALLFPVTAIPTCASNFLCGLMSDSCSPTRGNQTFADLTIFSGFSVLQCTQSPWTMKQNYNEGMCNELQGYANLSSFTLDLEQWRINILLNILCIII